MAEDVARLPSTGIIAGGLRRLPSGQLRLLRLSGAGSGDGPQRLRRVPPRRLGVGPAPAGRQHLGGRPAQRLHRGAMRGIGDLVRPRLPRGGRPPGRSAAAVPVLRADRRRPAEPDDDQPGAAGRDRAGRQAGPHRTSDRALPRFVTEEDGRPPDHRGAAADHPGRRARIRADRRGSGRLPGHGDRSLAPGAGRLHDRRHRPQGRRCRQRRAARLRGAPRGQQPGRRDFPAAQAGPPVGTGPVRARQLGLARPPGSAGRGVPAGPADGQRPAAGLDHNRRAASTTCGSSGT